MKIVIGADIKGQEIRRSVKGYRVAYFAGRIGGRPALGQVVPEVMAVRVIEKLVNCLNVCKNRHRVIASMRLEAPLCRDAQNYFNG